MADVIYIIIILLLVIVVIYLFRKKTKTNIIIKKERKEQKKQQTKIKLQQKDIQDVQEENKRLLSGEKDKGQTYFKDVGIQIKKKSDNTFIISHRINETLIFLHMLTKKDLFDLYRRIGIFFR